MTTSLANFVDGENGEVYVLRVEAGSMLGNAYKVVGQHSWEKIVSST